jgi:hypothetical protein
MQSIVQPFPLSPFAFLPQVVPFANPADGLDRRSAPVFALAAMGGLFMAGEVRFGQADIFIRPGISE